MQFFFSILWMYCTTDSFEHRDNKKEEIKHYDIALKPKIDCVLYYLMLAGSHRRRSSKSRGGEPARNQSYLCLKSARALTIHGLQNRTGTTIVQTINRPTGSVGANKLIV